jgi:flagellar hook assembly protein FlgD
LKIYNSAGRLVNIIVDNEMNPGYYTMTWNGKDDMNRTQGNGIYFIRLKTKDYGMTKKVVMVK